MYHSVILTIAHADAECVLAADLVRGARFYPGAAAACGTAVAPRDEEVLPWHTS
jgi:hypothetical protein